MGFDVVLGTVAEFIEITQTITAIFIIYYLIRFLFYSDPKAEPADMSGIKDAIDKLKKDGKEKKEIKDNLDSRRNYLNKSLGYLHLALQVAHELQERLHQQTIREVSSAKQGLGRLRNYLSTARRNTKGAHRHHKDDMTEDLHRLHAAVDAVYEKTKELLEENIPDNEEDDDFFKKGRKFREGANEIAGYIASLYHSVREFIEKHEQKNLQISASLKNLEEVVAKHKLDMKEKTKDAAEKQVKDKAKKQVEDKKSKKEKNQGSRKRVRIRSGNPPSND